MNFNMPEIKLMGIIYGETGKFNGEEEEERERKRIGARGAQDFFLFTQARSKYLSQESK